MGKACQMRSSIKHLHPDKSKVYRTAQMFMRLLVTQSSEIMRRCQVPLMNVLIGPVGRPSRSLHLNANLQVSAGLGLGLQDCLARRRGMTDCNLANWPMSSRHVGSNRDSPHTQISTPGGLIV